MRTAPPGWLPGAGTEVLIKEARRRQRRRWLAIGVAVAALLGGAVAVRAGVAGHQGSQAARATSVFPAAADGCVGQPPVSPLPVWARAGFTPSDQAMAHVMGASGNIVAIMWATRDALHAPPLRDRTNKILWVSRIPLATGDPLVIKATLAGSTRTATATVTGGPGPSIIDLPASGCWTLHLSWSGQTDELRLRYVA